MFSHITKNWRGRPLISHEVVVNLIANTTTEAGLEIQAALDSGEYPIGIKVSDQDMADLNLEVLNPALLFEQLLNLGCH